MSSNAATILLVDRPLAKRSQHSQTLHGSLVPRMDVRTLSCCSSACNLRCAACCPIYLFRRISLWWKNSACPRAFPLTGAMSPHRCRLWHRQINSLPDSHRAFNLFKILLPKLLPIMRHVIRMRLHQVVTIFSAIYSTARSPSVLEFVNPPPIFSCLLPVGLFPESLFVFDLSKYRFLQQRLSSPKKLQTIDRYRKARI